MRVLKIVAGVLGALVLAIALLFVGARFADGPIGPIPGGPLVSGEWVDAPVEDWGFAADIEEVELQLVADDHSRTTWIVVDGGRAYIPASLVFPPGKDWYRRADVDGAAIVRVAGERRPVTLVRERDEAVRTRLVQIAAAKYSGGPPREGEVWFFALRPRPS